MQILIVAAVILLLFFGPARSQAAEDIAQAVAEAVAQSALSEPSKRQHEIMRDAIRRELRTFACGGEDEMEMPPAEAEADFTVIVGAIAAHPSVRDAMLVYDEYAGDLIRTGLLAFEMGYLLSGITSKDELKASLGCE